MSMHLVECVRALDLPPSHKLAMVAFADSADAGSRLAMPGFEAVQEWSGLSRARTFELIADLKDRGLIRQESAGRAGRRATFTVFPDGCCELHQVPVEVIDDDPMRATLEALAAAGVELTDAQRQALAGTGVPAAPVGSGTLDPKEEADGVVAGQSTAPATRVRDAGPNTPAYDNDPATTTAGSSPLDPASAPGSTQGPAQGGPLPSFKNIPLTPSEAGGTAAGGEDNPGCRRHPSGDGRNCRACGTTARQLATAKRKADTARRRAAEQAAHAAAAEQRAAAAVPAARHIDDLRAARERIRASQRATTAANPGRAS